MVHYEKIRDMGIFDKLDDFFVDSIEISTSKENGVCWPADANFIVSKTGAIFWDEDKPLTDIKIWVECQDFEENQVYKGLFSSEKYPNPSKLCTYKNARSSSFLMSKILRNSDFCDRYMRTPIMTDERFIKVKTFDSLRVYRKEPLV